ncbi:cytochrome c [Sulfurimonas sp.]|uniref:c-type cytochrome n=1 Tax=Sulfurimonas sp. TaxID=2022749 RepID=UPI0035667460
MKKIILSVLLASITLFAADSAANYRPGLLLPPNGPAIYKQECASCHGEQGEKSAFKQAASVGGKISPAIAGMDTAKVAKDLKDYRYGSLDKYGYGALMKSVTADLSWDEIDAVAEYVHGLK